MMLELLAMDACDLRALGMHAERFIRLAMTYCGQWLAAMNLLLRSSMCRDGPLQLVIEWTAA